MNTGGVVLGLEQEANGQAASARHPTPLPIPSRCVSVSCGSYHTLALSDKGQIYAWGLGFGACGDDDAFLERPTPLNVSDPQIGSPVVFKEISAGDLHSLALDTEGRCWAWGYNGDGRLGLGPRSPFASAVPIRVQFVRLASGTVKATGAGGAVFHKVSAGFAHSALVDQHGLVFTFGSNAGAVLGLPQGCEYSTWPTATQMPADFTSKSRFVDVYASRHATFAISESGGLYSWGSSGASHSRPGMNRLGHPTTATWRGRAVSSRPTLIIGDYKSCTLVVATADSVVALPGVPGSTRTPQSSASSFAPSAVDISNKLITVNVYGNHTAKVMAEADLSVRQILERVGTKIADFDVTKYIPKDQSGAEISLDLTVRELKGAEINFKQLKPVPIPSTRKFTVHFADQQKNAIVWRPTAVLREVLSKMCEHRGIHIRAFVAKSLQGSVLDLDATLETLGIDEITFTTKAEPTDIKVLLSDGLSHTLRFNAEMLLGEALQRVCEHRGLAVWKFAAQNVSGQLLDPSQPLGKLDLPKRTIDFSTPRQGRWIKEVSAAQMVAKRIGTELRESHPRQSAARANAAQILNSISTAMEKGVGSISTEFRGHEVLQFSEHTATVRLRAERPTWLIHIAGTDNLIHGLPGSAVCIAFVTDGKPRAAAIYSVWSEELFFAEEGGGAYCGDTQMLFCSRVSSVSESLLCINPVPSESFLRLLSACPRTRTLGVPELEACYVARGSVDGMVNLSCSLWTLAGPVLIMSEAYCSVLDPDCDPHTAVDIENSTTIVSGTNALATTLVELVRSFETGQRAGSVSASDPI